MATELLARAAADRAPSPYRALAGRAARERRVRRERAEELLVVGKLVRGAADVDVGRGAARPHVPYRAARRVHRAARRERPLRASIDGRAHRVVDLRRRWLGVVSLHGGNGEMAKWGRTSEQWSLVVGMQSASACADWGPVSTRLCRQQQRTWSGGNARGQAQRRRFCRTEKSNTDEHLCVQPPYACG